MFPNYLSYTFQKSLINPKTTNLCAPLKTSYNNFNRNDYSLNLSIELNNHD